MSTISNISDTEFEEKVLKSDKPILVDFWAEWCRPCHAIAPILESLAKDQEQVSIVKINVDSNKNTATRYGVMSIPTLILFENGQPKQQIIGADTQAIHKLINSFKS